MCRLSHTDPGLFGTPYKHLHAHIYTHTHTRRHTNTQTHIHTHTREFTYIHINAHLYIQCIAYMYTHANTHLHFYIYIYTLNPTSHTEPESVETIMPEGAWSKRDAHCRRDTSGRGEARGRGVIFSVDSCTRCLCSEDGSLMCEERICPPLLCHRPVAVEGQCCPICQGR